MQDVDIRDLGQHLAEYLGRAERGELVRVTDRGRPKAVLGPLPGRAQVDEGVAAGWIRPGSGTLRAVPRARSSGRVLDALAGDRGE